MPRTDLILASSSPYRRDLLARLALDFGIDAPDIDETAMAGETPIALAARLAEAKARAVAAHHPGARIIGSDQTVDLDGALLGKPGSATAAQRQLERMQGHVTLFHTGLCLLNAATGRCQVAVESMRVTLRPLSRDEIARYVERERPFDCAGSLRSEALGIALIERMEGNDPNALIGLPLIRLVDMLRADGLSVLAG